MLGVLFNIVHNGLTAGAALTAFPDKEKALFMLCGPVTCPSVKNSGTDERKTAWLPARSSQMQIELASQSLLCTRLSQQTSIIAKTIARRVKISITSEKYRFSRMQPSREILHELQAADENVNICLYR